MACGSLNSWGVLVTASYTVNKCVCEVGRGTRSARQLTCVLTHHILVNKAERTILAADVDNDIKRLLLWHLDCGRVVGHKKVFTCVMDVLPCF